jgi:hypothetical protein
MYMYIYIYILYVISKHAQCSYTFVLKTLNKKNFSKRREEPDGFYRLVLTYEENVCEFIITNRSYSPTKNKVYKKNKDERTVGLSPSVEYIVILCAFLEDFQVTERIHIIHMPVMHIRQDARESCKVATDEYDIFYD